MKKTIIMLSVLILIVSSFWGCNKNEKNNAEPSTTAFTTGKESYTSSAVIGDKKEVFHRDENGNDMKVEHFDNKDSLIYFEEPVYDNVGKVKKCKYYDKKGNLIAVYESDHHFYDKDGKEISEDQFSALMKKAGAK